MLSALLLLAAPEVLAMPVCQPNEVTPVAGKPGRGPHKLGQEPPARQIYTVLRTENGCSKPVPVNQRVIGNAPRR